MNSKKIGKVFAIGVAIISISLLSFSTLFAAEDTGGESGGSTEGGAAEALLQQIVENTGNILHDLLENLNTLAIQWISPDTSQATSNMQTNFAMLGSLLTTGLTTQATLQKTLEQDLLNSPLKDPNQKVINGRPEDLSYSTILAAAAAPSNGSTPKGGAPGPEVAAYNYIKNAGGLWMPHTPPPTGGQGTVDDQNRYQALYNTEIAIESFNGYVLSGQYADGNQLNALQSTLMTQASDSANWFAQVASENIGIVLRQILMYESQIFVLLLQSLQVQKQMVSAQAMTNAMLIANNQQNERYMYSKADGTQPTA